MLKNNGKRTVVSVASTAGLCLLLLVVAVQHHRAQRPQDPDSGLASPLQDPAQVGSAQVKLGFSAYFTKLARGRREADKPARSSAPAADPPPAEDLRAEDIFIAVKTTKKFHQSRLSLLLDTWVSRNMQQVKDACRENQRKWLVSLTVRCSSKCCQRAGREGSFEDMMWVLVG